MEYELVDGACRPRRVHTIVISVQHSEDISQDDMIHQLKEKVIKVIRHTTESSIQKCREVHTYVC